MIYGFEWIPEHDRQFHYNDKTYKNEYKGIRSTKGYGFEWNKNDDNQRQFDRVLEINKTLILSDGEYKRFDGGSLLKLSEKTVIPKMSSNSSEIGNAISSNPSSNAWYTFDQLDTIEAMFSGKSGYVGFEFNESRAVGSYSVKHGNTTSTAWCPKDWTFEGSNDGIEWNVLDTQTGHNDWDKQMEKVFLIENLKFFKMYRLNWTDNNDYPNTLINELKMYEITTFPTISSWKTVSTSLPTTEQFQEEGMEDLSVFDRKIQPVLGSSIQMTNEELGEGKLFKGKVDFKKYFDLRNLEIK